MQHSILNLSHPYLNSQVSLIDLSQSDIQILYGLQIDNGIWQCVSSSLTGIFKDKFVVEYLDLLQRLFQIIKNGSTAI